MKKVAMTMLVLVAAFVICQGVVLAETVTGKVAGVNVMTKALTITEVDAATGAEKKVDVKVTPMTTFKGVASLIEVKDGNEVVVDATKDAAGALNATSVEVKGVVEAVPAVPAAPKAQ